MYRRRVCLFGPPADTEPCNVERHVNITTRQLLLGNGAALVLLGVTVYLTRATFRRFLGALIGGVTVTLVMVGADALARNLGWWYYPAGMTSYELALMYVAAALWYGAGVALIGWRLTRRFGWRGLVSFIGVMGIVGPLRDYAGAALTHAIVFAPGIVPALGDAACWAGGIALVQAIMRLVSGPARADRLRDSPRTSGAVAAPGFRGK